MLSCAKPVSGFITPLAAPVISLKTQIPIPPPAIGSGAPKKNRQGQPPGQKLLLVQRIEVSQAQRWLSINGAPRGAFWIGPLSVQLPQLPPDGVQLSPMVRMRPSKS
jgi:hypothetical protein